MVTIFLPKRNGELVVNAFALVPLLALFGRVAVASADGLEDISGVYLAAECDVVDDDAWINLMPVLCIEGHLIFQYLIILIGYIRGVNTVLHVLEGEIHADDDVAAAFQGEVGATRLVHPIDIIKELCPSRLQIKLLSQTDLPQVFFNDLLTVEGVGVAFVVAVEGTVFAF